MTGFLFTVVKMMAILGTVFVAIALWIRAFEKLGSGYQWKPELSKKIVYFDYPNFGERGRVMKAPILIDKTEDELAAERRKNDRRTTS